MLQSAAAVRFRTSRGAGRPVGEWAPLLALAFVLVATAALVGLPWWGARMSRALNLELTEVIAPARGHVMRIGTALAVEGSLLRDYLSSRDVRITERYHQAYEREREATTDLRPLAAAMGAHAAYDSFLRVQRNWHQRIDSLLGNQLMLSQGDPLRGRAYESLLESLLQLDAVFEAAGSERRSQLRQMDRHQGRLAAVLGFLAIGAVFTVAWLARGLRRYATTMEERGVALERATASRARLMSGITHDLKNPLHIIDGHAQLLADGLYGPVRPAQVEGVQRIRRASREMLALIGDLLDLAQAEAGALRMKAHLLDVRQLVLDVVDEHQPSAKLAQLTLTVEVGARQLPAVTDPARVRQVLDNLLSNALKYTPREGTITVSAAERMPEGKGPPMLALAVANSGPGIPEERQHAIFADFARLEEHADLPGAGLGLSIAQRVAHLLGGDLTLTSAPGEGATFTLTIPRDRRRMPERVGAAAGEMALA